MVGYFYVVGGLVVPGVVLIPLWLFWLGLSVLLIRLALRRSWWTPAVLLAAAFVMLLVIVFGDELLDWRP